MSAAYWTCIDTACDGVHHTYVAAHSLAALDAAEAVTR